MTAKVERLVNLTIALLETPSALSLARIKQRTGYYTQSDPESGRRMFERDKDELRALGVPIETVTLPLSDESGYRIRRGAYELPDLDLTAEEVAALALAVRLAGTTGTPLALAKLAARAPDPAERLPAPGTRVVLEPDPVDAVADAVVTHTALRFAYRTADGAAGERTVDPYAVVQRRGAWYLVARDHARDAIRAFRLDRMTSRPRSVGEPDAFAPPEALDIAAHVTGPELDGVDVELAVAPGARWAVQLRGGRETGREHDGRPVFRLSGLHPLRDRSWVLGLGPDVTVLEPPELREAVVDALRRLAAVTS